MAYKLFITVDASYELDDIVRYMSVDLANPIAAQSFLERVDACFERLLDNPKLYQLCDHRDFRAKGYRKVVINNYVLIYRYDESSSTVYILHIFFGGRDYQSLIQSV